MEAGQSGKYDEAVGLHQELQTVWAKPKMIIIEK